MIQSFDLAWIVVSDLKKARKFFVESLGLKGHVCAEEHGWLEVCDQDGGTMIGIAQKSEKNQVEPGQNAIITMKVDNIEETVALFKKKQVTLLGDIIEVPGHVKMQMLTDADGNKFQAVQML